ncbi:hypothetical protein VFPPC_17840 [Pochonia chlamydosporia 170]|uniref:Uncharacterized protein n=1 Tax=Pochonia chlamydosporia 170 TaxID=1380566 RepID=A0A219AQA1_METCM|nr:hypothetical protein VFPPC_17840 [Pochonia chlamydosporia 170]OWT42967.1 hypothetical protein VFPPC_17840 [Pochonia chlamydosporia 170]
MPSCLCKLSQKIGMNHSFGYVCFPRQFVCLTSSTASAKLDQPACWQYYLHTHVETV